MINVTRTYDPGLVISVMTHPEIWATCAEESMEISEYEPNMEHYWLSVTHGNQLVGLYHVHAVNSATLQIHAQILPEFRKACSKESARKVLQWVLDYSPNQYQKLIAEVPVIYPNVIEFTENAGFQREGLNRKSIWEHGELVDQVLLGITRDEIAAFLRAIQ